MHVPMAHDSLARYRDKRDRDPTQMKASISRA